MPWTTCSLTETQIEAGNPRYPLNEGVAPSSRMTSSATVSSSRVTIPGRTASSTASMVAATTRPARRILSISSGDFRMIMRPPCGRGSGEVLQRSHGPLGDPVLVTVGVDLAQQAAFAVVLDQRFGVAVVDLQAVPDGGLVVVVAVHQLSAAE